MAKLFSRCILHIGTEKTGTTSLQTFFGQNRELLAQQGFFVPRSLSPYQMLANHERLTTMTLQPEKLHDDLRRAAGLRTVDDVLAHREKVREDFLRELSGWADCLPPQLLLSNEHCHSRLVSDSEVQTLHCFLSEFARDFEVVVYLRPQHELATSLYDQALKAGYADIDVLPDFEGNKSRWVERRYFDYDDLTSRWSRVFGSSSLRLRIFSFEDLIEQNVVNDFLHIIGSEAKGMIPSGDENKSISAELQAVLNAVNRYAKAYPEYVTAGDRARVIGKLQKLSGGPGRRPSRSEAKQFYERFLASNERVREQFFPERGSLFAPDFSVFPVRLPEELSEQDALVRMVIKVAGA